MSADIISSSYVIDRPTPESSIKSRDVHSSGAGDGVGVAIETDGPSVGPVDGAVVVLGAPVVELDGPATVEDGVPSVAPVVDGAAVVDGGPPVSPTSGTVVILGKPVIPLVVGADVADETVVGPAEVDFSHAISSILSTETSMSSFDAVKEISISPAIT